MEEPTVYKLFLPPGMKVLWAAIFVALAGAGVAIILLPGLLRGPKGPPPLVGILFLAVLGLNLLYILGLPHRITLAADGTIEFIGFWRRRAVRAEEIRSIKPQGSHFGFYVVRTDRGKIRILAQFDDFHDFLTRLKALHPGVELRGC